ncbi:MAG TPA: hypothetical protein DEO65_00735 [Bacillus bacterium]|uniref:hypothetical protein n=1 Tax=Siminovitchia fordii TaxID=254759 RepID=UPI00037AD351|nr:hypothetical protein [Siminovitchia fordii]HBZ08391.1 hypothetical protein [Bacillus sp. (in: firmicutes)]
MNLNAERADIHERLIEKTIKKAACILVARGFGVSLKLIESGFHDRNLAEKVYKLRFLSSLLVKKTPLDVFWKISHKPLKILCI